MECPMCGGKMLVVREGVCPICHAEFLLENFEWGYHAMLEEAKESLKFNQEVYNVL